MHTYIVEKSAQITPTTLLLTLKREESERPLAFLPGQYAAISYEWRGRPSTARCFSIVSSPSDQHLLQFSIRIKGRYTTALGHLQPGDIVDVTGPFGGFVVDTTLDQKAVFIAGGIGIAPFMSMMRYMAALDATNDVTLVYSCATQDDIPFGDELCAIQAEHPNLKVLFAVSHGPIDHLPTTQAVAGHVTPELLDIVTGKKYTDRRFFICGPPTFMKAMVNTLTKQGAPKASVLTEAFTQASPRQTSILRSWPFNVYALGVIGVLLGSLGAMASDLLNALPPTTVLKPTKTAPYLLTNARQQQLDQLVNSIPPSPSVITAPTDVQPQTSTAPAPTAAPQPQTLAPIYSAPITAPAPACQTTPSGRCI